MAHDPGEDDTLDLLPALEVIEQQPLADRAAAYTAILDDLSRTLDQAPQA